MHSDLERKDDETTCLSGEGPDKSDAKQGLDQSQVEQTPLQTEVFRLSPQVYVISDGVPMSRRDICTAAVKSKHFAGQELPTFEVRFLSAFDS